MLDPHPPAAVDHALVLGDVAGRDRSRAPRSAAGSRPRSRRGDPARSRRRARASRRASRPVPMITASASIRWPRLVTTWVTRPSAPSKLSSSSSPYTVIPCSSSRSWKKRPASSPKPRPSDDPLEHHHRAGAAELGQRRRHLAGDVGATDKHHPLASRVLADRVAVSERPEVVDPLEL